MTVWIHGHCRNRTKYHTRDCNVYKRMHNPREVTKDAAERMGLDHCKMCQQDREEQSQDWTYQHALMEHADE